MPRLRPPTRSAGVPAAVSGRSTWSGSVLTAGALLVGGPMLRLGDA
ncbi:hypothetical protein OG562_18285 [Streptomyces sp. NBC_01275]|nr:hypothetical protein [Streptomyces sp. NBC_01275]MCX4762889.1 hypothetical protein [Streptomyces sp. NBC_01275]